MVMEQLARVPTERREEVTRLLLNGDFDHEGHAACVLELYPNEFRYVGSHGWYQWSGSHWQLTGAEAAVSRAVVDTLAARRMAGAGLDPDRYKKMIAGSRAQASNVNGVMTMLARRLEVEAQSGDFDALPDHLNVINGTIDLRTGRLSGHAPSDHLTHCLDIPYDAPLDGEAPEPEAWLNFLLGVGFDREMIDYLQVCLGYSITGRTNERAMWYLYGPPASGKGTITETMVALLGNKPLATGVNFQTFTSKRYGDTQMFDMAPLQPTRFIAASESSRYESINEAVLKSITGGDWIRCAFKGKTHFEYQPQFKIWLTSNFPPLMDVDDDAAWGRLNLINMSRSFLGNEDKGLKEALRSPRLLRAMLPWVVEGARRWYAMGVTGLHAPTFIREATESARSELDSVGAFLDDACEMGPEETHFTEGAALHANYRMWCTSEGYTPKHRRNFTQALRGKGIESKSKRVANGVMRGYVGVKIK